jgi:flagellar protein FliO/FliZ
MPDLALVFRALLALAFVLALIAGATWLARRYLGSTVFTGMKGRRRLSIVESLPIDGKSRLVLVRRDNSEHLLVVGPSGATVVEKDLPVLSDQPAPSASLRAIGGAER